MILTKFAKLIEYLAKCNGTSRQELDKRVAAGEVNKEEAEIIYYYAEMRRLSERIDALSNKLRVV